MRLPKDYILGFVVIVLVSGSLVLAILDPSTRATFTDLTKIAVGTYIGLQIPSPNQKG